MALDQQCLDRSVRLDHLPRNERLYGNLCQPALQLLQSLQQLPVGQHGIVYVSDYCKQHRSRELHLQIRLEWCHLRNSNVHSDKSDRRRMESLECMLYDVRQWYSDAHMYEPGAE